MQNFPKNVHNFTLLKFDDSKTFRDLDLRDCDVRLIWAQNREVQAPYLKGKSRAADRTVCWCLLDGEVRVRESDGEQVIGANHWYLPGCNAIDHVFQPGTRIFSIHFYFRMRGGQSVFPRNQGLTFPVAKYPDFHRAAERLIEEVEPWDGGMNLNLNRGTIPLHTRFQIEASLNHWMSQYTLVMRDLGQTIPPAADLDPRVARALMIIEEHLMHEKFNEKALAQKCGLSVNQLIRLFKVAKNVTPYEYYEHRREELARHSVGETQLPLKEIFYAMGFGSSSHFSRWFSARTGMSPSQFRKS